MYEQINEMAFILDGNVWYRYGGKIFTETGNQLTQTAKEIIDDNIYVEKCKLIVVAASKRRAKSVERDFRKFIKQKFEQ